MSSPPVLYEIDINGVATITLNRPTRNNAYTEKLGALYFDYLAQADADPNVKAIVITGAGRSFCVGADMGLLESAAGDSSGGFGGGSGPPLPPRRENMEQIQALAVRKPVVAAINGAAAGIGLVTALMADVRFAAEGTKMTTAFARRGLVAEHGSSWVLPRIVGHSRALDLLISGRVVKAEEALAMGMVNFVCPKGEVLARAKAYATDLALNVSPASMAAIKRQVYEAAELSMRGSFERADTLMVSSLTQVDFKEGVKSYVGKRQPAFNGLGKGTDFQTILGLNYQILPASKL
eukprot:gene13583-30542_t